MKGWLSAERPEPLPSFNQPVFSLSLEQRAVNEEATIDACHGASSELPEALVLGKPSVISALTG